MSRHNLAAVGLTNFSEEFLFTSCFAALIRTRLIAASVHTVVQDQQSGLRFGGDCPEFLCADVWKAKRYFCHSDETRSKEAFV